MPRPAAGQETGAAQQPPAAPVPIPEILRTYKPVTAARLLKPEEGDWLMIRGTYDGWGYSPLAQITPDRVKQLQPAWVFSTGVNSGHEAPPIVNNGVMFVATPGNQVIAIDAKTGNLLWRYRRPRPIGASVPHETNRGVALAPPPLLLRAADPGHTGATSLTADTDLRSLALRRVPTTSPPDS